MMAKILNIMFIVANWILVIIYWRVGVEIFSGGISTHNIRLINVSMILGICSLIHILLSEHALRDRRFR